MQEFKKDTSSRQYCITINNPDMSDIELKEYIEGFSNLRYCVFQREVGNKENTEHIQMYIEFELPKKFSTIKKRFPKAHIETKSKFSTQVQAREYCMKSETAIGSPIEIGIFKELEQGKRNDLDIIIEELIGGKDLNYIMFNYPTYYFMYQNKFKSFYYELISNKYKNEFRKLEVTYINGVSGIGKTRFVMDKYGYTNVFRVTNYNNPQFLFDGYNGEDVVIFEEFRSQLPIDTMLNYLDGYPLLLNVKNGRVNACYTKVFIITNWHFTQQYKLIQESYPETYKAFKRRVHHIHNINNESDLIFLDKSDTDVINSFGDVVSIIDK